MSIHKLSPRLANQIAAGEVVERPASVVKELLENSLDAGATRISIDIERGGTRLIRVFDNGSGVDKAELPLALARHATSKISQLEDLGAITSLGFRGEALASISSVSRLTFASRRVGEDGWQARAEGSEMAVEVTPAALPPGTLVEVRDLFFNTPARQKFLRAERTEFSHIEEVVRRIALGRFDASILLSHNGKPVRRIPAASSDTRDHTRLGSVMGRKFASQSLWCDARLDEVRIHGWLGPASLHQSGNQQQQFYVNGRSVRDRLLNHALRQAYAGLLPPGRLPAYVLYLDMPPAMVDVNVHPTKHEVRFANARQIHDFIGQIVAQRLQESEPVLNAMPDDTVAEPVQQLRNYRPDPYYAPRARPAAEHWRPYFTAARSPAPESEPATSGWREIARVGERFGLLTDGDDVYVADLQRLAAATLALCFGEPPEPVALLLPERLAIADSEGLASRLAAGDLQELGFEVTRAGPDSWILRRIPQILKSLPAARVAEVWLGELAGNRDGDPATARQRLVDICASHLPGSKEPLPAPLLARLPDASRGNLQDFGLQRLTETEIARYFFPSP